MKKQYSIEQIAEYLSTGDFTFDEFGYGTRRYGYTAYVDEEGNLTYEVKGFSYGGGECFQAEYYEEFNTIDDVWGRETLEDDTFREICEDLMEQVNTWIDENIEDENEDDDIH